jgi:hypothetical protein
MVSKSIFFQASAWLVITERVWVHVRAPRQLHFCPTYISRVTGVTRHSCVPCIFLGAFFCLLRAGKARKKKTIMYRDVCTYNHGRPWVVESPSACGKSHMICAALYSRMRDRAQKKTNRMRCQQTKPALRQRGKERYISSFETPEPESLQKPYQVLRMHFPAFPFFDGA